MLVEIYHAEPPDFDCERDAREFPKGYVKIATVSVEDFEDAYATSQNGSRPWLANSSVKLRHTDKPAVRSTSCGDVLVRPTMKQVVLVDAVGFRAIQPHQPLTVTL